jgi:anthranilate phosphoribosyltransferase
MLDIPAIIREVGRGKNGARDISRPTASALYAAMLDGEVSDLLLGAIHIAFRIKGESVDELAGFLDACQARIAALQAPGALVIPSYNGARHTANLVPLLALLVAARGIPVLVHGVLHDPKRVTSAEVFAAMGMRPAESAAAAEALLARDGVAFLPIDRLLPGLASLLDRRWQIGLRSSAHTLAKMLMPIAGGALQLVSVTHPEYLDAMRAFYARHPARVLLMRGTEGEAVASSKRPQAIEWLTQGVSETVLPADPESIGAMPDLPEGRDAQTTADWIDAVLAGRRPVPPAIARQVAVIEACAAGGR